MYLEEILEDLKKEIKSINKQIISLEKKINNTESSTQFAFINQLSKMDFWPYSPAATRKMISRGKLIEGVHYQKVDGRIICNIIALKNFIAQKFTSYQWSA